MEKKKSNLKRNSIIAVILIIIAGLAWLWHTWANGGFSSTTYKYYPFGFDQDQTVWAGLMAEGSDVALQYFPGGYSAYPIQQKSGPNMGKRVITSFEIMNPYITSNEAWPLKPEYDILYRFEWMEQTSGRRLYSEVKGSWYKGQDGWVDLMPAIIDNARYSDTKDKISVPINHIELPPPTGNAKDTEFFLIRTFWADDAKQDGQSKYTNISKKFAFRTSADEVGYLGVAKSNTNLWSGDSVLPEDLKNIYYATVWVAPNHPEKTMNYEAVVDPHVSKYHFITVDMDNRRVHANANPEIWNSYIDVTMFNADKKPINSENRTLDGVADPTLFRVAPYNSDAQAKSGINDSHGIIPPLGEFTSWDPGPSGSFQFSGQCALNRVTVGSPAFPDCYSNSGQVPLIPMPSTSHPGLTQHTVHFGDSPDRRTLIFSIKNPSSYVGNAFAFAGDFNLYGTDLTVPSTSIPPDVVDPFDPNAPNTSNTGTGGVTGTTSVEVDPTGTPDGENGFDDNGKFTASGALHTYKTEVCNYSGATVHDVYVSLHQPLKTSLVGSGGSLGTSSLMINDSRLNPSYASGNLLDMANFTTDISFGNLNPGMCKFITYQVIVDPGVTQSDEFRVVNDFKYESNPYQPTNEVVNKVSTDVLCSLSLTANPVDGSKVSQGDYIEYTVKCKNTGINTIQSGSIDCIRQKDTLETNCKVGQCTPATFTNLGPGSIYQYVYSVQVNGGVTKDTVINNVCSVDYDGQKTDSNQTNHTVDVPVTAVSGGDFTLELNSRPKLINTPNGQPRPDGLDQSPIKYTYRYTGSNQTTMYPELSQYGTYTYGAVNGQCGGGQLPYKPNTYTYQINSASSSPRSDPNPGNNGITYSLSTTLPSGIPKTTLYGGTLSPTHTIPGNEINSWYKNGGFRDLPISSTTHRALVNGIDGKINATINGTLNLDKWQYVPYSTQQCKYNYGCQNCIATVDISLYRWEKVSSTPVNFSASAYRYVDVSGSTGWFRTRNGDVHTNNRVSQDGTDANTYDLGEAGYTSVKSAPKLYTPPGSAHSDYFVSTNTDTSNLVSKHGWYTIRDLKFGHGYHYDRDKNPRDYYGDLLDKQKFGKVVKTGLANPLSKISLEMNTIYYYPGDLTIEDTSDNIVTVNGNKGTIVVGGNLYIKSNLQYANESKELKYQPYLGLIVRGNTYISPTVTGTVGAWHIDGTLHTGVASKAWKHLGQVAVGQVDLQRKATEYGANTEVNAPSEDIMFDDQIYATIPPGFAQLDDGQWAYFTNVNQFSGKVEDW